MIRTACCLPLALLFISMPAYAGAPEQGPPSFRDIEYEHSSTDVLEVGRAAILQAIPIGTNIERAKAILVAAGARCKLKRNDPQIVRCLYRDVSLGDEAVDDIRWETVLHIDGDRVSAISVDREIDRHGTA